jgi:putative hydrolase of the HAD superfamily
MTARIKNVVFDMGGVVLEWNPENILAGFYADANSRATLRQSLFQHPDWRLFNRGQIEEPELLERTVERTRRSGDELTALLAAARESLQAKPATVALLRSLQRRGIPLYCLSDMPVSVYRYLRERHDFWDAFSGIVISAQVQLLKPEPAIFAHLLSRYGLQASETVFIDDLSANTDGARASGMHAIQFLDIEQVERELLPLLG